MIVNLVDDRPAGLAWRNIKHQTDGDIEIDLQTVCFDTNTIIKPWNWRATVTTNQLRAWERSLVMLVPQKTESFWNKKPASQNKKPIKVWNLAKAHEETVYYYHHYSEWPKKCSFN